MGYLVQKQGLTGFTFHRSFEEWQTLADEISENDARKKARLLLKNNPGKYRVKDIYSGKVLFEIKS